MAGRIPLLSPKRREIFTQRNGSKIGRKETGFNCGTWIGILVSCGWGFGGYNAELFGMVCITILIKDSGKLSLCFKNLLVLYLLWHWISGICYITCRCNTVVKDWYSHQSTELGAILRWLMGESDRGLMRSFDDSEWVNVFKLAHDRDHKFLSDVYWTVHHCDDWGIKNELDATCYFIALLVG